jgi:putative CocE/NonD family hydrolase
MLIAPPSSIAHPQESAHVGIVEGEGRKFIPSIKIPMRDGVKLAADIYVPSGKGPFPAILVRTPYNKNTFRPKSYAIRQGGEVVVEAPLQRGQRGDPATFFVSNGYAVVIQDFRGRWESEGEFRTAKSERLDFEDTVTWLNNQPWFDGRMGMWGCSYPGEAQVVAAATGVPSLKAIAPMSAAGPFSDGLGRNTMLWHYSGGAREFGNMLEWYADPGSSNFYLKPDPSVAPEVWARFAPLFTARPQYAVDVEQLTNKLPIVGLLDRAGLPPTDWNTVMSNGPESDYWFKDSELLRPNDQLHVPALWIGHWNDIQSGEALDALAFGERNGATPRVRENQYMIMAPGGHCSMDILSKDFRFGDLDLGDASFDIWDVLLRWNDFWVKEDTQALQGMPKITYWLYGRNEWRAAESFPLKGTKLVKFFLSSGNGANSLAGDGTLSRAKPQRAREDRFVYDPAKPVPSPPEDFGLWRISMVDQRHIEERPDVLVYTSDPLKEGLTITGKMSATLYVSSDAVDTDVTAKILDVHPDGRAIMLQNGILRARYRASFAKPELMKPGTVYPVTVELNATANWFAPGHRIRLEISSSHFPRFDRNLNTGGDNYSESAWVTATNSVFTGGHTVSYLLLPVVPDNAER